MVGERKNREQYRWAAWAALLLAYGLVFAGYACGSDNDGGKGGTATNSGASGDDSATDTREVIAPTADARTVSTDMDADHSAAWMEALDGLAQVSVLRGCDLLGATVDGQHDVLVPVVPRGDYGLADERCDGDLDPNSGDGNMAEVAAVTPTVYVAPPPYAPTDRDDPPVTPDEFRALVRAAGASEDWVELLLQICLCESSAGTGLLWPGATGDGGSSLGMCQLWSGWFPAAGYDKAQWYDPGVNAATAVYVREVRGRFGGSGGWSCADILGIY